MQVLIVESNASLGFIWRKHLERLGHDVILAPRQSDAIAAIRDHSPEIVILDLVLEQASALAIADFASYRAPQARVIFVSAGSFFSDGSIFSLAQNACAFLPAGVQPEDLCAMVEYYGAAAVNQSLSR